MNVGVRTVDDFVNITNYELYIEPFVRDFPYWLPCLFFWFAVQHGSYFILNKISKRFQSLSNDDKLAFCVRLCAITNSFSCYYSAFIFFTVGIPGGFYVPSPGYGFNRILIVSYFSWDIFVVFRYNWDVAWKIHAIVSFLGTYFMSFPFADQYAAYFAGVFEMSNSFIHFPMLLQMMNLWPGLQMILKYTFAFLFLWIRVVGGTYVSYRFLNEAIPLFIAGEVHGRVPFAIVLVILTVVMLLQYVWFWEIVQIALGWKENSSAGQNPSSPSKKDDEEKKSPVVRRKKAPKTE